jgi:hypothetical protein
MSIDNPCSHIDGEAVLVASHMLHVRIFLSPYMAVYGVENAVVGKGTLIRKEDKVEEVRYLYIQYFPSNHRQMLTRGAKSFGPNACTFYRW